MHKDDDFRPKALITGAASGIGRAVAIRFANDGYDVCLNDINVNGLVELVNALPDGNHLSCPGDYSDASLESLLDKTIRNAWGRIDALISCAGVFHGLPMIECSFDEWWSAFQLMVVGAVRTSRFAAPFMTRGGRIVHITSIHAERAELNASAYSMAKAAVNQLCRASAVELASQQILVNGIAPGFVRTAMSLRHDGSNELESDWFRANYLDGHHLPLRRAAEPEEIAGVAAFLAGPDSGYVTGQVIAVDGGLSVTF